MTKLLVYTFKNFPSKKSIAQFSPFEFHKLKEDLKAFTKTIEEHNPKLIIGITKSPNNESHFETKTINVFNHNKKITKNGKDKYLLSYPANGCKNISINKKATNSFCNWTMYKISQLIENKDIKLQFIHITKNDISDLKEYLNFLKQSH